MRGNWESSEALVLAPNQQHPQQQPSMMEDHHPLHSPTTPAWGISDRIAKGESTDDKNNDSGVSPGHYTSSGSPRSGRSSPPTNCSLSPGSIGSGDSQAMHVTNYDYRPQALFKNCPSPLNFSRIGMDADLTVQAGLHQSMEVGRLNSGSDDCEDGQDRLQCPVCQFTTQNRLQFTEHLATHYSPSPDYPHPLFPTLSPLPSPTPMDDARATPPSCSERSEPDCEDTEEPGVRTPRVNSQGKVKTFRCKQCTFVAVTKLSFWEHSRGHIKAEKLLTCPKCPFVTEYKHHLEYHLRNHFGSKPFKCDKCTYSCVNKSMLNSHLKSHSNIYQYRCANCSYATKYCHSLKLHLRKYAHQPAMVLNADGSPNPLPIIDVYGTRRGPKQKSLSQKNEDFGAQQIGSIGPIGQIGQMNHQIGQMNHQIGQISQMNHQMSQINQINQMNQMGLAMNNGFNPIMALNPFNTIFSGYGVGYGDEGDKIEGLKAQYVKANLLAHYAKAMVAERVNADLENSPKSSGTNRRKGKAVKLNRQIMQNEDEEESNAQVDEDEVETTEKKEVKPPGKIANVSDEFTCQFCDIAFGNEVMYTVHMGYHGYSNPFTCNMCGHQCDDKVSFFLHIARVKHA